MPSACLEIHHINVSQGDSVLIINRDLQEAFAACQYKFQDSEIPTDPIDLVPFTVANNVDIPGTIKKALLIDGGDNEFGGDIVNYLKALGVVSGLDGYQPDLVMLVSHYHDDHIGGLHSVFKKEMDPQPPPALKTGKGPELTGYMRPAVVRQALPNTKADPVTETFATFQADAADAETVSKNPGRPPAGR